MTSHLDLEVDPDSQIASFSFCPQESNRCGIYVTKPEGRKLLQAVDGSSIEYRLTIDNPLHQCYYTKQVSIRKGDDGNK